MGGLIFLAFKNQWSAHMKKPLEFFSSLLAIILNNSFYLYGIYLLAILSIGDSDAATREYLVSTGMVLTSWGLLNVLGGGLYQLGALIETGELEAYLAKPRSSLFLVAISKTNLVSIGEVLQGIVTIGLVVVLYGYALGTRTLINSIILTFGFAGVIIIVGAISFFSLRGSQLSYVILQVILSLSLFPVSRALRGREKLILYLTPLLMTATLPRLASLEGGILLFVSFIMATIGIFLIGVFFFNFGLKRYKAKNYILLNE